MVQSTFIIASLSLVIASSFVVAQDQQLPTVIPSGFAIPTEAIGALSSLLNNPFAVQSYISMASEKVGQMPTQYQASAYSALSEASKTLAAVQSKNSQTTAAGKQSLGHSSYKPANYVALVIGIIVVSIGIIL